MKKIWEYILAHQGKIYVDRCVASDLDEAQATAFAACSEWAVQCTDWDDLVSDCAAHSIYEAVLPHPPRVAIIINGGVVQDIIADQPCDYDISVIDFDNRDADPSDLYALPLTNDQLSRGTAYDESVRVVDNPALWDVLAVAREERAEWIIPDDRKFMVDAHYHDANGVLQRCRTFVAAQDGATADQRSLQRIIAHVGPVTLHRVVIQPPAVASGKDA
jgi:hypothetical protein